MFSIGAGALLRPLTVVGLSVGLIFGVSPAGATDGSDEQAGVVIQGGSISSSNTVALTADATSAGSVAGGGSDNGATISDFPVEDGSIVGPIDMAAGNGGGATADGSGGSVALGETADDGAFVPAPVETGNNVGNDLVVGDTSGGAVVAIAGPDVTYQNDVSLSADGGAALASAAGGDSNEASLTCGGGPDCNVVVLEDQATVSDLSAAAGNGAAATADASGGSVQSGSLLLGDNAGGTIHVGDTVGEATVGIDGGSFAVMTGVAVSADGGAAAADANGGDSNLALFTCDGEACDTLFVVGADGGEAILSGVEATAGNGGVATAFAVGGDITGVDIIAGGNTANTIAVGNTTGSGGLALVDILGGDVAFSTGVTLSADAGLAVAAATGGDDNIAIFTCDRNDCSALGALALGDGGNRATLTGIAANAGNGGGALADASGGTVAAGAILSGDQTGNTIAVGNTAGGAGWNGGDARVVIDGGTVTARTAVTGIANGGSAIADGSGGDGNLAAFSCSGGLCLPVFACVADFCGEPPRGGATISDVVAAAGNGGSAGAAATGGVLGLEIIDGSGNGGHLIAVGDTIGGASHRGVGGDATVLIDGGTARFVTAVSLVASGGVAVADASGGDANVASDTCRGRLCTAIYAIGTGGGAATITDVTLAAGNGGTALADASGGGAAIGDIRAGGNVGNVLSVGNTPGGTGDGGETGGETRVVVAGGTIAATTLLGVDVAAVAALASASGGDANLAALACEGRFCEVLRVTGDATLSDITVRAGNGGIALAAGGRGAATADGGTGNAASIGCDGPGCPVIVVEDDVLTGILAASGNGGKAAGLAPEGTVTIGDVLSGGNVGNVIALGDTAAVKIDAAHRASAGDERAAGA